jgi:progressive ankylosis protein
VTPNADAPAARTILLFWTPLALQWILMAGEGPFLAAVIARMDDAMLNLAAYAVAFALAILVESPVIMLMSASTAIVEDATSYRRLRNFAMALNAGASALLLLVLVPPVHDFLMYTLLGLPPAVAGLVYGALWILLPWPGFIGYRRFLHGVLIRAGRTRLVAIGTAFRLAGMATTALFLYHWSGLPGAWVGAAALSAGVVTEALAARVMARGVISGLLSQDPGEAPMRASPPSYAEIARFYYPLALTSFIALTVQPVLTFFMGRSPLPVQSLAVFPVVHALSFLFRAPGFAFQETVIALAGRDFAGIRALAAFGIGLGLCLSGAFALVAFTPAASFWFETVSGLPPELAGLAASATGMLAPLPALAVMLALQHGVLVKGRRTRPITFGSVVEVATIAAVFYLLGWRAGLTGVFAAALALVAGRVAANILLLLPSRATVAARAT